MTRVIVLLLLPLALVAAGCGGSTTAATGAASGAEITPASAVGFVSLNTDAGSEQWQQADELLQKFPAREKLFSRITRAALADEDLDFERDVRPALGPTLDFAVVGRAKGQTDVVGMTQPADRAQLEVLLRKGRDPAAYAQIDGWTVFAEDEAALAPFRVDGDKLEDTQAFRDAMDELPEEANAKAFFEGRAVPAALERSVPLLGALPTADFEWVSAAVSSEDEGWKIEGVVKGGSESKPFDRSLLEQIPTGTLLAIAFNGGNTSALDQLRNHPRLSRRSGQFEQLLGIGLDDIVGLLGGDAALYVRPGAEYPEVTLVARPDDPEAMLRMIDAAVTRVSLFSGRPAPTRTRIGNVVVREVSVEGMSVYYGVRDGALIGSTATTAFGDYSGASLEDDPVFTDAAAAAELPDDAAALVFVNVHDSLPVLEDLARDDGNPIPPDVLANLRPLDSFLGFSTPDGDIAHFSGLLQVS